MGVYGYCSSFPEFISIDFLKSSIDYMFSNGFLISLDSFNGVNCDAFPLYIKFEFVNLSELPN